MVSALSPLIPEMADGGISGPKYGNLSLAVCKLATNLSTREPSVAGSSITL